MSDRQLITITVSGLAAAPTAALVREIAHHLDFLGCRVLCYQRGVEVAMHDIHPARMLEADVRIELVDGEAAP